MNFEWISFGVKPSLTKNIITTQYSILSILRDTDNTAASDNCIKQTTWWNDLQFHMDAYDRCTNLGKKILAVSVAICGQGRELLRPPIYERNVRQRLTKNTHFTNIFCLKWYHLYKVWISIYALKRAVSKVCHL